MQVGSFLGSPSGQPFAPYSEYDAGVSVKYQTISAMTVYRKKSQEEIRLEDYAKGRKVYGPSGTQAASPYGSTQQPGMGFGQGQQPSGGAQQSRPTGFGSFGTQQNALGTQQAGFGFSAPKPSFGTSAFGGATSQPAFGATTSQPAFGGATSQPAFGGTQSSLGGTQSAFGGTQSAFGGTQPAFGGTQPAFGGTQSSLGGTQSAFGGTRPSFGGTAATPSFGGTQSAFGGTTAFGGATTQPSSFGTATQPAFGATTPAFGAAQQTQPGFGGAKPFGGTQSAFGTSSLFEKKPGAFGETQQKPFGSAQPTPFGAQTQQPTPFASQATQSQFGAAQPSTLFGGATSQPLLGAAQQTAFGGIQKTAPTAFGSSFSSTAPTPFGSRPADTPALFGGRTVSAQEQPKQFSFGTPQPDQAQRPFSFTQSPTQQPSTGFLGATAQKPAFSFGTGLSAQQQTPQAQTYPLSKEAETILLQTPSLAQTKAAASTLLTLKTPGLSLKVTLDIKPVPRTLSADTEQTRRKIRTQPVLPHRQPASLTPTPAKQITPKHGESFGERELLTIRKKEQTDYYTVPPLEFLKMYSYTELGAVEAFVVGRKGVGSATFLEPVDLTAVDFSLLFTKYVQFENKNFVLYPEKETQPEHGKELNVKTRVELERCWPVSKVDREPIKEGLSNPQTRRHVERLKSIENTVFVDYVPKTGTWVFTMNGV